MFTSSHRAPAAHVDAVCASLAPAVAAEARSLAADPGAYPILRLARAIEPGAIPSAQARRAAVEVRDRVLARA